jgi:phosphatidate cytidylyltransferase
VTDPHPARYLGEPKPKAGTSASELGARVASALVLGPVALAVTYLGGWLFLVFWAAAAVLVWWEWISLVDRRDNRAALAVGAVTIAVVLVLLGIGRLSPVLPVVAVGAVVAGLATSRGRRLWVGSGVVYAAALLVATALLRADAAYGAVSVFLLFAVVWTTDVTAYFAGRAIGGPKLCAPISPKKTWSGAVVGLLGATAAAVIVVSFGGVRDLWPVALAGLGLSAVSQAGDLLESHVKRRFGAKDAGHLIPGHGGVMDRLDGFIAAAAAAAVIGLLHGGLEAPARGLIQW